MIEMVVWKIDHEIDYWKLWVLKEFTSSYMNLHTVYGLYNHFLQNNSHTAALGFTYCVLSDNVGGMSVFLFICCFLGDVEYMKQLL